MRVSLLVVALLAGTLLIPSGASGVGAKDAVAQIPPLPIPTPTLPDLGDILKPPKPDPQPPSDSPGGGEDEGGSWGSGAGGAGGESEPDGGSGSNPGQAAAAEPRAPSPSRPRPAAQSAVTLPSKAPRYDGTYVPVGGSFTTDRLTAAAARLRSLGIVEAEIMKRVYAPFIIGGPAAWTDTWGAPRYGPGPIVRTHEGQDVFCTYGDPVLATETGRIDYGGGGLGGMVARLFRPDGSYWYFAHLSGFNNGAHPAGSLVEAGEVIGYCGNTGNAITTPSHVHFGWYQSTGVSRNPMAPLVRWLRVAQRRALGSLVTNAQGERLQQVSSITLARRFGDSFIPAVSTFEQSAAAVEHASPTNANAAGTFEMFGRGVMTAVSQGVVEIGYDPAAVDLAKGKDTPLKRQLDAIIEEARRR